MGCGEDPIVARAREAEAAAAAAGGAPARHDAPAPATPPTPGPAVEPGAPAEPTPGIPAEPPPGGATPGGEGVAGAPKPGVPEEPKPGVPEEPKPGVPGSPGGNRGPTVAVSGVVSFAEWRAGQVRISAFDGDHGTPGAKQPKIVAEVRLERPGPFTLPVPEGAGPVFLEAAVDEDGDGRPGPQDPQGRLAENPLVVRSSPISGLTLTLTRRAPPPNQPKSDY